MQHLNFAPIRGEYSKYIHETRRAIKTPDNVLKPDGTCAFGTFETEFPKMDFLKINGPTSLPNAFNRLKLTLWEATEIHLEQGVLLAALCDMGFFSIMFHIFYDKRTHQTFCWDSRMSSKKALIAPTLINGDMAYAETPNGFIKYINTFNEGRAELSGCHKGKCLITVPNKEKTAVKAIPDNRGTGSLEYDLQLTRLSGPSIVSIPFSETRPRPLYSQKDFFQVSGKLTINGEEILCDENTTAVIDDHRGYYPRRAHYDWVTTMGRYEINGEKKYLAFNLTRNQSIDQEQYNENILWLEGATSLLPPVTFTRTPETKDFRDYAECLVKDEYGMVNLKYKIYSLHPMITHALLVNIDYYITFGELEGFVLDEAGNQYDLTGCVGIGEDKTLLF
ncbi:MAG: DUF2804 domain-containing protein [Lachnospiraceae bacterium]|nr:DUF2804 domain-containing protein [Lachnospiraceae bacterium]